MLAVLAALALGSGASAPKVEIVAGGGKYTLMRDGKEYVIRGAGCSSTDDASLAKLAKAGGNSIRTWGIGDETQQLLDNAHKHGITVTLGYWLGHTAHGFKWDDQAQLDDQFNKVRAAVRKYKNHPAVLMWQLGNEMEQGGNDNPRLWKEIDRLAKMVKQEDPSHPVGSVVADMTPDRVKYIQDLAPTLDVVGINSYGGLPSLDKRLKDMGFVKPFVVTEFGPMGQWEVGKTPWGVAIEPTSTEKAGLYARNYKNVIEANRGWCLGSYAFIWGHKQEETATWFGMMLPTGENLGAVDEMTRMWSGKYPANRSPRLESLMLAGGDQVEKNAVFKVRADVEDPDRDAVTYQWIVKEESTDKKSGGYAEAAPPSVDKAVIGNGKSEATIKAPDRAGAYRVFLFVKDGKGSAATGNIPFLVK